LKTKLTVSNGNLTVHCALMLACWEMGHLLGDGTLIGWCDACWEMWHLLGDVTLVRWCDNYRVMWHLLGDVTLIWWCDTC